MLIRELEKQGDWLFRRRSYVPLLLAPFAIVEIARHRYYLRDSAQLEFGFEIACLFVSLCGLLLRALTQGHAQSGSSGRNTREQIAEHLNTRGIYSVVRHPLYLGNMLIILGVLLFTKSIPLVLAGMLFYLLVYERIMAGEERFLDEKFGETFRVWASRTPALWPRLRQWEKPSLRFSWRAAIKGEFYGATAIVSVMTFLSVLKNGFVRGRLTISRPWLVLLVTSLLTFLVLRFVRKHTRFLEEPDRREICSNQSNA